MANRKRSEPPADLTQVVRAHLADAQRQGDDLDVVELLRAISDLAPHIGLHLSRIAGRDPEPAVRKLASMVLLVGLERGVMPDRLRRQMAADLVAAVPPLLEDRTIGDEEKLVLSALYQESGGAVSPEQLERYFDDFESAVRRSSQQTLSNLSDDPESVEHMLRVMHLFGTSEPPAPDQIEAALHMAQAAMTTAHSSSAGAMLACSTAAVVCQWGLPADGVLAALEVVSGARPGARPDERVAWYMRELGGWPGGGAIAARARVLSDWMQAAGVTPQCSTWREFSHGHVSFVDGAGSRSLTLFFRTPEGGMDGLVMLVNDRVGMKDAWCAYDDSTEIEEALRDAADDLLHAHCTLELARELVADAWQIHAENNRPPLAAFFHLRPYLGEAPIVPRRRTPNLGAYMLELIVGGPALVRDSAELAKHAPYADQWFSSDESYRFVQARMPKRGRRLSKADFDQFVREIAPVEAPVLVSRMGQNLEQEAMAGRARQRVNQIAAQTYVAMSRNVCPPEQVPYVREMARIGVERIIENLRQGLMNQREANTAGMQQDRLTSDAIDDLMGPGRWSSPGAR